MSADVHDPDDVALDIEDGTEVAFDADRVRTPNKMPCWSGLLPAMPFTTPNGRARKGAPTTAYTVLNR